MRKTEETTKLTSSEISQITEFGQIPFQIFECRHESFDHKIGNSLTDILSPMSSLPQVKLNY